LDGIHGLIIIVTKSLNLGLPKKEIFGRREVKTGICKRSIEETSMKGSIVIGLIVAVLSFPIFASESTWQIDPDHSNLQFKIQHLTVSNVKGSFAKAKGVVNINSQNLSDLKVDLTIDVASINTNHAKRDEHLRGPDFFDVVKYPVITFVSKKVTPTGTNRLKVTGDLTIRNITREVTVDVEGPTPEVKDPWGHSRRGATGTTRINRKDFGITWNKVLDTGGLVVGDEVDITVEVELVRK
jgi:polyisoprenoid-binding protein YceI